MGYYHIELSDKSKEMCNIFAQWVKYEYHHIPNGSVQQHQHILENMSEIFISLVTLNVYTNELLHLTKVSWTEHLTVLKDMFTRLHKAGLKVNARKS